MVFQFTPLRIPDVVSIRTTRYEDARGFFSETYRQSTFEAELGVVLVQDNLARSAPGVLRGLHFQRPPMAQGKLIHVVRGEIYDVAVDLRPDSPTRGEWVAQTLSADSGEMLWIPPGFAHGYSVTSDTGADVAYKVTMEYDPGFDAGIRWDDPDLAIEWPGGAPILSDRDRALPTWRDLEPTP